MPTIARSGKLGLMGNSGRFGAAEDAAPRGRAQRRRNKAVASPRTPYGLCLVRDLAGQNEFGGSVERGREFHCNLNRAGLKAATRAGLLRGSA